MLGRLEPFEVFRFLQTKGMAGSVGLDFHNLQPFLDQVRQAKDPKLKKRTSTHSCHCNASRAHESIYTYPFNRRLLMKNRLFIPISLTSQMSIAMLR